MMEEPIMKASSSRASDARMQVMRLMRAAQSDTAKSLMHRAHHHYRLHHMYRAHHLQKRRYPHCSSLIGNPTAQTNRNNNEYKAGMCRNAG
jgi:hypothetical protein